MSKGLVFLFAVLFSISSYSQGYEKLLDNTSWLTGFTFHHPPFHATWWHTIGDTNIGVHSYTIVENDLTLWGHLYNVPKRIYLREDTVLRRVYYLDSALTTETIWYDFGLSVNDTFPGTNLPVLAIDTIQTDWGSKRILLSDTTWSYDGLIEGVGWKSGYDDFLRFHHRNPLNWHIHFTGCMYKNRIQVYNFNNTSVPCQSMCPSIGSEDEFDFHKRTICQNKGISLEAPCDTIHRWSTVSQPTVVLSTNDIFLATPNKPVTQYVWQGSMQSDTITITVIDTLKLTMDEDTTFCGNLEYVITPQVNMPVTYRWMNDPRKDSNVYVVNSPRDYWLEVKDSLNCHAVKDTVVITHLPFPEITANTTNYVSLYQSPFNLTYASPEDGVYTGPGVNNNQFDPAITGVGTYTLSYVYVDSNGCADSVLIDLIVFDPTVGIEESSLDQVKIFPNPASDFIQISGEKIVGLNYSILDVTGSIQVKGKLGSDNHQVDISQLGPGMYFLMLQTESQGIRKAFIVK